MKMFLVSCVAIRGSDGSYAGEPKLRLPSAAHRQPFLSMVHEQHKKTASPWVSGLLFTSSSACLLPIILLDLA